MFADQVIEYRQIHYCSCGKRIKEVSAYAIDKNDVSEALVFQNCCKSCRRSSAMIKDYRKKRTVKGV